MSLPPYRRSLWLCLLAVHVIGLVILFGWGFMQTSPVPIHDLRLGEGEKLRCVSYAPYHHAGQTPFDTTLHIDAKQIRADLAALAKVTECVRLYSVSQGLDQVPSIAQELGLKVLLGAWIGADTQANQKELNHAIKIANTYPDTVRALIVGNEVLLRRERTADEMLALLTKAKTEAHVPVTYADVWEFWLRNDRLATQVDFVTVHILPFWEDKPVSIDTAQQHIAHIYEEVQQHFTPIPVLIGETGWPSAGRQREVSLPSRVNQARFIREFIHQAHEKGWNYNLIEAIDQPWKRQLEGTVGGHWGILNAASLEAKFPLAGPVSERDSIQPLIWGGVVGLLLCLLCTLGTHASPLQRLTIGTMGAFNGALVIVHAEHAALAYRSLQEWGVLYSVALSTLLLSLIFARWSGTPLPNAETAWQTWRHRQTTALPAASLQPISTADSLLGLLHAWLLFAAAVAALLLLADPRYRDFPTFLYLGPAVLFAVIGWHHCRAGRAERICALIITLGVCLRWVTEPANPQAVGWLLTGLALALPALAGRHNTSSASSPPTAAPS